MTSRLRGRQTLRAAALSGGRWRTLESVGSQVVTIVTTIALVRLFSVEEYGLVAAVLVLLGFFELFTGMGFAAELTQRPHLTQRSISTTFWSATVYGLVIYLCIAASAVHVATGFGVPAAGGYVAIAALAIPVNVMGAPGRALLVRELRFRTLALVRCGAMVGYAVTTVSCLLVTDLGVWAVVVGKLVQSSAMSIAATAAVPWHPSLRFSLSDARARFGFNLAFWGTTAIGYVAKNADYWIVGRLAGQSSLGIYYVAYNLPSLVRQRVSMAIHDVMFPVLAKLQKNPERLERAYLQAISAANFLLVPPLVGAALVTHEIVVVVFGDAWLDAATPMALLCLAAAASSVMPLSNTVLLARGTPAWSFVGLAAHLGALGACTAGFMANGLTLVEMALAVLISAITRVIVDITVMVRLVQLSVVRLMSAACPLVPGLAAMAGAVLILRDAARGAGWPDYAVLIGCVLLGGVSFFATSFLVQRSWLKRCVEFFRTLLVPARSGAVGQEADAKETVA